MTHHPDIPVPDELGRGAMDLLERHFAALNAGDREAFRATAYIFEFVDGLPFERWWFGMRSIAPLSVVLTLGTVEQRTRIAKEPHVDTWIHVVATSATTSRTYSDDFVVWYLVGSGKWKLGCRIHWWLDGPVATASDRCRPENEGDDAPCSPTGAPDGLLPYFERFSEGQPIDDEFVRGVAIIRRWQAMAQAGQPERAEYERIVELLESEGDPESGWYDLWRRMVAWGVASGLTSPRRNPWARS